MILQRLAILRTPGIDDKFELKDMGAGLILIVGDNGTGKTSVGRLISGVLWPESLRSSRVSVVAEWDANDKRLRAERDGRNVEWQSDGVATEPPSVPPDRAAACFQLEMKDLLSERNPTDEDIAAEVRTQMAGGYDIEAVRSECFALKSTHGRREDEAVRKYQDGLRQRISGHAKVAQEQDSLVDLKRRIETATDAKKTVDLLDIAKHLAVARGKLNEYDQRLAGYPDHMEHVRDDDVLTLDRLLEDSQTAQREVDELEEQIAAATRVASDCSLPAGAIEEAVLQEWTAKLRSLRALEEKIRVGETEVETIRSELVEASRTLDTEASEDRDIEVTPAALDAVEEYLRRLQKYEIEKARVDADSDRLEQIEPTASREIISKAIDTLRGWNSVSDEASTPVPAWRWVVVAIAGALGLVLGYLVWPGLYGLTCVAAGMLAVLLWLRSGKSDHGSRYREEFRDTGFDAPGLWTRQAVREKIRELEELWKTAARAEIRRDQLESLGPRLERVDQLRSALAKERDQLRTEFQVDPGTGNLALADIAGKVATWRKARGRLKSEEAGLGKLRGDHAELLEKVNTFLREHEVDAGESHAEAASRVDDLRVRSSQLRVARATEEKARVHQQRRVEEVKRHGERLASFWSRLELRDGDRAGLQECVSLLPEWRQDRAQQSRAADRISVLEPGLSGHDELTTLDAAEIDKRTEKCLRESESLDTLKEDRVRVEEAVKNAMAGNNVEEAKAAVEEARDRLEERREEALRCVAGELLLRTVQEVHERENQPPVLRRAAELFAAFTRHEYALKVDDRSGTTHFRAIENSTGRGKGLMELSDATRLQLLLAGRIAFALGQEKDEPMPLILDEVLTTTDPRRFHAVAQSLTSLLGEEKRQIFYMTANPGDVANWREFLRDEGLGEPTTIDLGEIRFGTKTVSGPDALDVAPATTLPSPEGLRKEEYGVKVGVTPVDPRGPFSSLHLFHVMGDDMTSLSRLLRAGFQTAGQWRSLVKFDAAKTVVGEHAARRINASVDAADAYYEAWQIGRGSPVTADVVDEAHLSPGASRVVRALIEKVDGDSQALMEVIDAREDELLRGFRTSQGDRLRDHLRECELLDERPRLESEQILTQVLVRAEQIIQRKEMSLEDIVQLVHELHEKTGRM